MPNPKTRKYPRVYTNTGLVSLTKQSFKDECNINKIMDKFQKTGALNHYSKHQEEYGDATHIELLDAQLVVANATTMFEELPSSIRKKFDNNPTQFLEFVQDERNAEEMVELGLRHQPQPATQRDAPIAVETTPEPTTNSE